MKHEQTEQPTELLRHIENTKFLNTLQTKLTDWYAARQVGEVMA